MSKLTENTRITFRSPNCDGGKPITLRGFKLDEPEVHCNFCGVALSQKEIVPSVITLYKKETEGSKDIHSMTYVTEYLCFNCIEKLTGRRPDNG